MISLKSVSVSSCPSSGTSSDGIEPTTLSWLELTRFLLIGVLIGGTNVDIVYVDAGIFRKPVAVVPELMLLSEVVRGLRLLRTLVPAKRGANPRTRHECMSWKLIRNDVGFICW